VNQDQFYLAIHLTLQTWYPSGGMSFAEFHVRLSGSGLEYEWQRGRYSRSWGIQLVT